jgi:hypothetical protein
VLVVEPARPLLNGIGPNRPQYGSCCVAVWQAPVLLRGGYGLAAACTMLHVAQTGAVLSFAVNPVISSRVVCGCCFCSVLLCCVLQEGCKGHYCSASSGCCCCCCHALC